MSNFEHATPRPWFVHDFTEGVKAMGHTPTVADVTISCDHPATLTVASMGNAFTGTFEEARDNARLMVASVTARDELVNALHNTYSLLKAFVTRDDDIARIVLEQAETAIAKAEGWNV